ncbi:MAG: DUF4142 domain-containing protein [Bdellovibrionota bacterium]
MKRIMHVLGMIMVLMMGNGAIASVGDEPIPAGLNKMDVHWMKMAAESDLLEIQLGQYALTNADNANVKEIGAMLVADHTAHLAVLNALATAKGVTLPTEVCKFGKKALEYFSKDMTNWDKRFLKFNLMVHKMNIKAADKEMEKGMDADVKAAAEATKPSLVSHYDISKAALDSLPDDNGSQDHDDCGCHEDDDQAVGY